VRGEIGADKASAADDEDRVIRDRAHRASPRVVSSARIVSTRSIASWVARLSAKGLVKDGGSIVLMSSVAATHGQAGMSLYCASKGAVESLVRAAAVELAPKRIRVNAIRAGAFASPMHSRITQGMTEKAIDDYAQKHLFGFGRPEDVAYPVVFLLSDMARWVTGSIWNVDGGYSAK
jgi:NAD(P)-dependent dehydrogenase (short-subunit alcohol dehydrogenase family)